MCTASLPKEKFRCSMSPWRVACLITSTVRVVPDCSEFGKRVGVYCIEIGEIIHTGSHSHLRIDMTEEHTYLLSDA